eukprot:GFYU01005069.1.p1 GENE.GFYU01005069.1~~GFYU01005069.1.p1  ORF type:complete len:194 (+),score=39.79 GFYU01005069.1:99-680(+)
MLTYLLRNMRVYLEAVQHRKGKVDLFRAEALSKHIAMPMRVRLMDIDYNMHMNNSKFIEAFEMARMDLMSKTGLTETVFKKRLTPIVASLQVVYYKPLTFNQQYTINTQVAGWDDRWMYFHQSMTRGETVCATLLVKAVVLQRGQRVTLPKLLEMGGADISSMAEKRPLAPELQAVLDAEDDCRDTMRKISVL